MPFSLPIDGHFGRIVWDMDLKFELPIIYINLVIQTNFEVNQTQIGHFIPKKLLKLSYLKTQFCPSVIHQKAYSSSIFQWIFLKLSEFM